MIKIIRNIHYYKKFNKKIVYSFLISIILHLMIYCGLYKQYLLKKHNHTTTVFTKPSLKEIQFKNIVKDIHNQDSTQHSTQIPKKNNQEQSNRLKITNHSRHSQLQDSTQHSTQIPKKNNQNTTRNTLIHNQYLKEDTDFTVLKNLLDKLTKTNIVNNHENNKFNSINTINNQLITNNNIKLNEINAYKNMICESIQKKFYNASDYTGKKCQLKIQLALDGKLISINTISGDLSLSQAATIAVKLASIPAPPNINIYEIFKNTILNFSP